MENILYTGALRGGVFRVTTNTAALRIRLAHVDFWAFPAAHVEFVAQRYPSQLSAADTSKGDLLPRGEYVLSAGTYQVPWFATTVTEHSSDASNTEAQPRREHNAGAGVNTSENFSLKCLIDSRKDRPPRSSNAEHDGPIGSGSGEDAINPVLRCAGLRKCSRSGCRCKESCQEECNVSDDISDLTRTVSEEDRFGRTNVSWLVDR